VLAAALTGRRREFSAHPRLLREFSGEAIAAASSGEVALVFGTERHGLSNGELALCHVPVAIPADAVYPSLNLAAAVQVVAYELRMAALGSPVVVTAPADAPATFDQVEGLIEDLQRRLLHCGFLDPHHPRRLMPRLRRLLARARLEREEVNLLRGMLRALDAKAPGDKVDRISRSI
jgi:tRNA/rRNA methyltransferase